MDASSVSTYLFTQGVLGVVCLILGVVCIKLYKFKAYRNAAYTPTNSSTTKYPWDAEEFDTNNNFDTTNNRYVAPVAGFYWLSSTVQMATNANVYGIYLYKNGSVVKQGNRLSTGAVATNNGFVVGSLLQLAAGDYIEVFMFNNSGSGTAITVGADNTYFSGFLVSRT